MYYCPVFVVITVILCGRKGRRVVFRRQPCKYHTYSSMDVTDENNIYLWCAGLCLGCSDRILIVLSMGSVLWPSILCWVRQYHMFAGNIYMTPYRYCTIFRQHRCTLTQRDKRPMFTSITEPLDVSIRINHLEMRNMNTQHVTSMTESKSPPDFDDRRMTRRVKEGATKRELQVPKPQDPNGECFVRSYSY
uniref:Uncharacterized protein n=1 Tax=Aspergillus fumigatus TaxID=746128 RepID=Q6MYB5_ASPFM|nr:hypothetical protein AfA35g10.18 [Aspergillus fumigatus]